MVIRTEEIISKLNRSQYNKNIGVKRAPTEVLLGLDDYIVELKTKLTRHKQILNQK